MRKNKTIICICGGGNAAHVLAGLFGNRGYVVNVFTLEREAKLWKKEIKVQYNGKVTSGKVNLVSPDPKVCTENADHVFLCGPSHVNPYYLKSVGPFIRDGCIVGAIFGQGGTDWAISSYFGEDFKKKKLGGYVLQICPWACRISKYGESVDILGEKSFYAAYMFPKIEVSKVHTFAEKLFDRKIQLLPNSFHLHFLAANQCLHPSRFYGLFRNYKDGDEYDESERKIMLFYEEMDSVSCELMISICKEMDAMKNKIMKKFPSVDLKNILDQHQLLVHWYGDQIEDSKTLQSSCRTNKAYKGIRSPLILEENGKWKPDWKARYLWEDIPFGLLILHNFGELLELKTPTIDKLIKWGQEKMGIRYLDENGKLTNEENIIQKTGTPRRFGILSIEDLIKRSAI